MKSGMIYEQGEILLVPFPFSDLSSIKQRPVLVLSKKSYNQQSDDLITCGITSNLEDNKNSVVIDNSNLLGGKIPIQSRIKVDKLFSLNKEIIRKKIARVNSESFEKVKRELFKLI